MQHRRIFVDTLIYNSVDNASRNYRYVNAMLFLSSTAIERNANEIPNNSIPDRAILVHQDFISVEVFS